MTLQQVIKTALDDALKELYTLDSASYTVEFPSDSSFGDYTTNVSMALAKELKKSPRDIAIEIIDKLKEQNLTQFSNIEVKGAFINFSIATKFLREKIEDEDYSRKATSEPKRILVEYGQPNTHKLPHIGHLFSYIVGDSIARLFTEIGHSVMKANYEGDIGPHVAKALYGWIQKGKPDPKDSLERVRLLQLCYQEGNRAYTEDPIAKETIDTINKGIYAKDKEYIELWGETRQWSVDYYAELEKKLDVNQTFHYWESNLWEKGLETVEKNIGKVFKKSQDAIIFPGSKYGLHDRVFITKRNTPTYEAKDLGLNFQKYKDWQYDINLITTASEQNAYFDVVIKAFEACFPELKGKVQHLGFGMISLSTGKMSSRTGNILSAIDLIQAIQIEVSKIMEDRVELEEEEKRKTIDIVTMGAVKFAFLKQNILQDSKFDLKEAVSFEGKSGPYIQYTYARIQTLLNKDNSIPEATSKDWESLDDPTEIQIMRTMHKYFDILNKAAEMRAPHVISEYVYDLAKQFNSYYAQVQINGAESDTLKRARRTLSYKVGVVIKKSLNVLGISVVDRM